MASINGTGDFFPQGQCTYGASLQYHNATGYWVPWGGNAKDWAANAYAYGWEVSSEPVVPSIICLQPGIQLADGIDGHVGVVQSINPDGSVTAVSLNWGTTQAERQQYTTHSFKPGPGVSFIYAVKFGNPVKGQSTTSPQAFVGTVQQMISPNEDVVSLLVALDAALDIQNPFDVTPKQDTLSAGPVSLSISDPVDYVSKVATGIWYDLAAMSVRLIFIVIGALIMLKVSSAFIDYGAIAGAAQSAAKAAAGIGVMVA